MKDRAAFLQGEFLRHFGTDSLDELPRINPVKVEDFKAEAEEEAKLKLEV